jgi:thiamine-monophosphate kinase
VRAMMDVSDGIDSDLRRIMEKSNCGMDIDLDRLPVSQELARVCRLRGWDSRELAAAAGEDYCLLLTAVADRFPSLAKDFAARFGRPLHPIGVVTARTGQLKYFDKKQPAVLKKAGWDHFRSAQKAEK